MALQYSPSIVTNGLVYCSDPVNVRSYPGTGTSLFDISNSGYTGTLTNGPIYTSGINGYFTYDGVDDRVVTSFNPNYLSTTWEAWIYCTQNISTYNMFMGSYLPYFGFYNGNSLIFSNTIGSGQQTISATSTLSLNTWYYTCFTTQQSGSNTIASIYVNGVLDTQSTLTGLQNAPSYPFGIGDGEASFTWYPFKGRIGPVKLYNRTLSAAEILQNFNAIRGRYGL